jgi:hypothetical protein
MTQNLTLFTANKEEKNLRAVLPLLRQKSVSLIEDIRTLVITNCVT